ncbi:unnamed protein product [Brassica rapa]|uniref:Ribosomal L28e/Mak16 domain-containing protein n=2 Tax=Brassica TaxID=3705 RepID=A0A8D9HFL0_BRACM|nr:unnamed protein product [Brassica napus]CAF2247966.1 unnamed protein product [Brassica napus]CAG7898803.1 unnamed protein product [Brassica rapa]
MSTKPLIVVSSTPSSTLPFLSPALFPSPLSDSTLSPPSSTVVLGTTKTNKQNELKLYVNKFVLNKEFPRMAKAVANQTVDNYYKPDLKKTTLARHSVISKGLRVAKSHLKKRNMQA